MIQISNPSLKKVVYNARIDGSDDFSLPSTTVRIDPQSIVDFFVGVKK
jgi:hypothetical protein